MNTELLEPVVVENEWSHSHAPIRHTYPLAVKSHGLMAALTLCLKTLPVMWVRLGILVGFTVCAAVWYLLVAAIAGAADRGASTVGWMVMAVGLGLPVTIFFFFKRYVLYLLEMAHIAVLTRFMTHGQVPGAQLAYGKDVVRARFGEVNLLLVLDGLVQAVVNVFTGTLSFVTSFLPIPGIEGPMRVIEKILQNATQYIGDTMFSYNLARGDANPWRSSKDGLVYYAQNWKPILKTAVYALIVEYVFTAASFVLLAIPVLEIRALLPSVGLEVLLLGLALALNVRAAFIRPVCLTMVMLAFHESIRNQEINPAWDAKLDGLSKKARELTERARNWAPAPVAVPLVSGQPVISS